MSKMRSRSPASSSSVLAPNSARRSQSSAVPVRSMMESTATSGRSMSKYARVLPSRSNAWVSGSTSWRAAAAHTTARSSSVFVSGSTPPQYASRSASKEYSDTDEFST